MVKLVLYDCNEINKLPPLWQLPSLQFLKMHVILNLQCFCGGGGPLFTFKKLKNLDLFRMPIFETWWDINEVQGQVGPVFPEVEKLSISDCKKLTALPRASSVGVVNPMWRSAFPALKELELNNLTAIQRWEAVEETPHAQVSTFPSLEKLLIRSCPVLTTLPEASKLKELVIWEGSQQICMRAARYCITHTSLSRLELSVHEREATLPTTDDSLIKLAVDDKEMWNHESSSSTRKMMLDRCNFLLTHSSAPVLWSCFVQLEDLEIWNCAALVHWPENVFWCLVSLRNLRILKCHGLTGRTQQEAYYSEQSTSSVLPPRLESLLLAFCDSLVEVPTLPASLRELEIRNCGKLESVVLRKQLQQNINLGGVGDGVVITKEKSSSFSPYVLLKLDIGNCDNLQSLSVQLDRTKLNIQFCSKLKSLDELPSLESLDLWSCKSLESMPNVPQAYSSLRHLTIKRCRRLKVLPPCLKQRLNEIKDKYLDHRYTTGR